MTATVYYILVESTTQGWALYNALRAADCACRIAPVPRGLQACCGMAVLVESDAIEGVRAALAAPEMPGYVDIVQMENQYNPKRDVYC
ncbi:MAG: DUF3343 domain-containing protein [Coriobacteriia bacterium]|nr:DUF3343 domain-containing protein [Coriobacteriia bacterium]